MFQSRTLYLDNGATTPVDNRVLEAMQPYLQDLYGNASSQHTKGFEANKALKHARSVLAKALHASEEEIIFTSGGTESNNFALKGIAFANQDKGKHIITTAVEHKCILQTCKWLEKQGFEITYLGVDSEGFIAPEDLKRALRKDTILVSILHANNEVGTIQDLDALATLCKENGTYFHTDACQSFTKVPLDMQKTPISLVSLNAHKIHGPKGVGALYVRKGTRIDPLLHGGDQEQGLRAGTENIPGIVGFAKAVQIAKQRDVRQMTYLRDQLIGDLLHIEGAKLNGPAGERRLCNNINIFFLGVDAQALGGYLDRKNISTSTGSACTAITQEPSYVLQAIGLSEEAAASSIRITLSRETTKGDILRAAELIKKIIAKLRKSTVFDKLLDSL